MERNQQPWLGIELRHLAALCAVAREGSFRGAAESLGYVQSAVSQQLAQLEQIVGVPLVVRRRGQAPPALTEQGELLLGHCAEILRRMSAAQADMEAMHEGRVRVGLFESAATGLMPQILAALGRSGSRLQVGLEESRDAAAVAERVEQGALDVAFGVGPLPPGPFATRHLMTDPYVLLAPASWSLPPQPDADELAALPLVGVDDHVKEELRALGAEHRTLPHSTGHAAMRELVAAGLGAAILPRLSAVPRVPRTVTVELDHVLRPRLLVLYWHRDRRMSPSLDAFLAAAADVCGAMGARRASIALAA
jgi:DNA-binding transcriptional LysR family regulator